jgi:hypothetical protein
VLPTAFRSDPLTGGEVNLLATIRYNAPVEVVTANDIRRLADLRGWEVRLGTSRDGPEICGTRFMEDFGFTMRPLEEYLAE